MYSYVAKSLEEIDNGPGMKRGLRVGVFRIADGQEELVGEYIRNYPALFNSFYYFQKDDQDYALYSPDYTATRILQLPSCKDLGGEEPCSWGFCPVDYYVPSYVEVETTWQEGRVSRYRTHEPRPEQLLPQAGKFGQTRPLSPLLYYPFGFVAGAIWADDSTYKIQYLDLSDAEHGIVKRDDRFGYIEMVEGMTLKQAVDMSEYLLCPEDDDAYKVTISILRHFDLRTGKPFD